MGKSLPSTSKLYQFTKMASPNFKSSKAGTPQNRNFNPETSTSGSNNSNNNNINGLNLKIENPPIQKQASLPLSEVVSECVKRWFRDTLKEAKAGDIGMQVLVGQMYHSGYGTPKDAQKGKAWITRASKTRSSALKVGNKPPGYNVSDSDSDELKDVVNELK